MVYSEVFGDRILCISRIVHVNRSARILTYTRKENLEGWDSRALPFTWP